MSVDKVNEELVLDDPAPDVEVAEEPDEELPEEREPDPADELGDEENPEEEEPEPEEEEPKPKAKIPDTPPEEKPAPKAPVVEETEDGIAATYDKAISVASSNVRLLKQFMDGRSTIKSPDGSEWTAYDEMTPSQRREVDKLLTKNERDVEAYAQQKDEKIRTVRSAREMTQLEKNIEEAINGIATVNPAFRNIDEGTRERLEARYFKLLRSGRMPTMTDQQIVESMTSGITPVKAGKNGAAPRSRRNTNTVRKTENSFRARVDKADEPAVSKVAKSDRAAVEERFRKVMGYDPSPGSEIEDLIIAIKRNRK